MTGLMGCGCHADEECIALIAALAMGLGEVAIISVECAVEKNGILLVKVIYCLTAAGCLCLVYCLNSPDFCFDSIR